MGTRHLICVVKDKEYRIAQYGQWDGYPSGQGVDVLAFCKKLLNNECRTLFEQNLSLSKFLDDQNIEDKKYAANVDATEDWDTVYPELSRDTGGKILELVLANPLKLVNNIEFAADSLFCEWCYVIDLDKNRLEIYKGFNNHTTLTKKDRFFSLSSGTNYQPVIKIKHYNFSKLPSQTKFLSELEPSDGEDED